MGQIKVTKTPIKGLFVIEPTVHVDHRGYFMETYNQNDMKEAGLTMTFVQDNQSMSTKGVLRGLHFQKPPYSQAKLVSCIMGEVLDVALDLRSDSPTYGQSFAVVLSGENHKQFFIPKGFAHGFSVLSEKALFAYKCDELYHPEAEGGVLLTDPDLHIDWQIPAQEMILSEKDTKHPLLSELPKDLF